MKNERRVMKLIGRGFLLCGLLGLNGCDYWPPALQTEIEALRADLEEAMDERQQLDGCVVFPRLQPVRPPATVSERPRHADRGAAPPARRILGIG